MTELCNLQPIKVIGLTSNSMSNSDQWIVTIADGTKLFIKIFVEDINPNLEYEILIYERIIKPLVKNHICPFFIPYVGSGNKCTFTTLLQMITGNIDGDHVELDKNRLLRNLYFIYLLTKFPNLNEQQSRFIEHFHSTTSNTLNRPTLQNTTLYDTGTFETIIDTISFKYLILHAILPNTYTIKETNLSNIPVEIKHTVQTDSEKFAILYMIIYTCMILSMSNTIHNDLHLGNIYIHKMSTPINYQFEYRGGAFDVSHRFTSIYKVMVYDFDNSYASSIGPNPYLTPTYCAKYNYCNKNNPLVDLKRVLYSFNHSLPVEFNNIHWVNQYLMFLELIHTSILPVSDTNVNLLSICNFGMFNIDQTLLTDDSIIHIEQLYNTINRQT